MTTLSLRTEHATLDELEAALAPRVDGGAVFLPAPADAPVGERVVVEVALASGEVALAFAGYVCWRYPPEQVPSGREAGDGVVVDEATDEARALLSRLREQEGAGTAALAPGTLLAARAREAGWLREPRLPTVVTAVRPLPSPPSLDDAPPPPPALVGAFFVYADERGRAGAIKQLERFSWPAVGTQRPSADDARFRPPGDMDDDDTAPWDEITDGQRAAPAWEESDPSHRVTDVVSRALDDMAEVDGALEGGPHATPKEPTHERVEERRADDVNGANGAGSEGEIPAGLRLRVDDGAVEPLLPAGAFVPASRTLTLSGTNGHPSVKVAVFEGARAGGGRHLGTVHVRVPPGEDETRLCVDVRAGGFVEVRSPDDGSVAERWRMSTAEPAPYPAAERRRRRWLPW